jgi:diacylglycerol kinase (ATP)
VQKKNVVGFKYAINGIIYAFKTEYKFKIHIFIAVAVIAAAIFFKTSYFENLTLILVISLVFLAEMINSAIEKTVDLICIDILKKELNKNEYNIKAGLAKDIAAGAVLVSAINSVVIGLVIFFPKILEWLPR